MRNYTIRKMTARDVDGVVALGRGLNELLSSDKDEFWTPDILREWIVAEKDIMLAAEAGGEVVGFLLTQLHLPSRSGYLSDIMVHPEFRRQGVATNLVEEALKRMKPLEIVYVYGLTKVNNGKIHELLQSFGFYRGDAFYWFDKEI